MATRTIRYSLLAFALAALPTLAVAQTYGDKPQQQPAATTPAPSNDDSMNKQLSPNAAYQKALAACEQKPSEQQQACRDAATARYAKPGSAALPQARDECAGLSGSAKSDCLKNIAPSAGANTAGRMVQPASGVH
jgi:hypothetical protein